MSFQTAGEGRAAPGSQPSLANNLSETFQSAYRAHHSTETALLDVTNCFLGNADEGRVSILTLLDF